MARSATSWLLRGGLLLAALTGAVYAGARNHERIGRFLGGDERNATSASEPEKTGRLWTCSMHPQVIQDRPGLCPICHMELTPLDPIEDPQTGSSETPPTTKERRIAYWWDPMLNPPFISDRPGKSPMGMDLIPVYDDEVSAGSGVTIDPTVVQNMGLRTEVVAASVPATTIRAVGDVRAAEPLIYDITVKFPGWIEKLHADVEGQQVTRGGPLFDFYSPDLLVAQAELQSVKRALDRLPATASEVLRDESRRMLEVARKKLALWDLTPDEVSEIEGGQTPKRAVTIMSPVAGTLVEKAVVQGAQVGAGTRVLRLADLSTVWIDAKIPESDLAAVTLKQSVHATVRAYPGRAFSGVIEFIHPLVDATTRTVAVRLSVANADGALKPGMYATAEITREGVSPATVVSREAIIDTGTRQIAFVARGQGKFDPREVTMGADAGEGRVEILKGLAPGETVVVSGQFLLEAESRTREAIRKMLDAKRARPGPPAPAPNPGPAAEPSPMIAGAQASGLGKQVDAATRAYLDLVEALAADSEKPAAGHAKALAAAAAELETAAKGNAHEQRAVAVRKAADTLARADGTGQRRALPELGSAMIAMLDSVRPSRDLGKLFVFHCSMFPGDWLQRRDTVANPFYGKEMSSCGSLVRTIDSTSAG